MLTFNIKSVSDPNKYLFNHFDLLVFGFRYKYRKCRSKKLLGMFESASVSFLSKSNISFCVCVFSRTFCAFVPNFDEGIEPLNAYPPISDLILSSRSIKHLSASLLATSYFIYDWALRFIR